VLSGNDKERSTYASVQFFHKESPNKEERGRLRKSNKASEFDQSTLYVCMEISQRNPFE
jgi:hypothetical protein